MSSDSELDEFFDAEDVTPKVSFLDNIPETTTSEVGSELEAEERRLLELKMLQEERRRKEDEEYQCMLLELQKKKEKQMVTDEKMLENEKRRKRLEEMKKRLENENGSPQYADDVRNQESYKHESDTDDELLDDSDSSNGKSPRFSPVDSQTNSKIQDYSYNITDFCPEKEKPNKKIPELKTEDFSEDMQDAEKTVESVLTENQICSDQDEPDIIKSTKTKTPPNTLSTHPVETLELPVAPPRRKKKDVSNDELASESSTPDWNPKIQGLPLPTPTTTVESLTKELEYALDLQSALGGGRHINAEDAEKDAVNSDQDSPRQQDSLGKNESKLLASADLREEDGGNKSPDNTMTLRPRSNSGRLLTDQEILESISVLNLDTGESVPLSTAEEKIPSGLNPLSLHIMRRTKEYHSDGSLKEGVNVHDELDFEETRSLSEVPGAKKKSKLRKIIGKKVGKTMNRMKTVADQVIRGEDAPVEEEAVSVDGKIFKIKNSNNNKGPYDFKQIQILQDLSGIHTGAIWTMKFSPCGRLLATGGQDTMLRIWVLKSASSYFDDLRQKYADVRVSPAPSQESLNSSASENSTDPLGSGGSEEDLSPFMPKPFCTYRGHTADLLDVSWSKNCFILSSSMDKTVRLWHISRRECLCTFQHIDFVTAIVFHPRDDRYFLSGSLDKKLRLWNIPEKKVTMWNEASNLITTANFCHNGKFAVAGTYDGKCIFYSTEQLKYYTQIHVRSTRGKNARGRKITGIEPLPGEDKVLVTSNDSRIRMYDLRDLTLTCKYKGCTNNSSQIKASFSSKAKYIICGSEDHFVYIWKTQHEYFKFSSARRDRNDYWEAVKVHNAVVTAAVFAPNPALLHPSDETTSASCKDLSSDDKGNQVLVTADFSGAIKVIQNKAC